MIALEAAAAAAVVPRAAASVLILRDAAAGLEVLMVRRSLQASFMPGSYVFPGGAVDAGDALAADLTDEDRAAIEQRIGGAIGGSTRALAFAVAALRECFEECGLWLGEPALSEDNRAALRERLQQGEPLAALAAAEGVALATSALQPWSHWLTPLGLPKRFDTLFFVCRAPHGQAPSVDAGETTTLAWVAPREALAAHARGEFGMEFATQRIVESLLPFGDGPVQALLDAAAARAAVGPLPLMAPRLQLDEQRRIRGILLPGQPGFDELPAG